MQSVGDHLGCPTGWDGWKDWCYYTPRKASVANYADAEERCQFYGGDLVSIHDQAEQSFVTYLQAYASELFFLVICTAVSWALTPSIFRTCATKRVAVSSCSEIELDSVLYHYF